MESKQTFAGGLWCRDVLEKLSDYVDGELTLDERTRIDGHLAGCDWCARFGGDFGDMLSMLRISAAAPVPKDAAKKLAVAVAEKMGMHEGKGKP